MKSASVGHGDCDKWTGSGGSSLYTTYISHFAYITSDKKVLLPDCSGESDVNRGF